MLKLRREAEIQDSLDRQQMNEALALYRATGIWKPPEFMEESVDGGTGKRSPRPNNATKKANMDGNADGRTGKRSPRPNKVAKKTNKDENVDGRTGKRSPKPNKTNKKIEKIKKPIKKVKTM